LPQSQQHVPRPSPHRQPLAQRLRPPQQLPLRHWLRRVLRRTQFIQLRRRLLPLPAT
jgi:hypothetical protein